MNLLIPALCGAGIVTVIGYGLVTACVARQARDRAGYVQHRIVNGRNVTQVVAREAGGWSVRITEVDGEVVGR